LSRLTLGINIFNMSLVFLILCGKIQNKTCLLLVIVIIELLQTMKNMFRSKKASTPIDEYNIDMEDASYGSGTEMSVPPPPPPPYRDWKPSTIHRSRSADEGLPRQAYLIEDTDSIETLDVSYWPSYWNEWFAVSTTPGHPRRIRRICVSLACLLVLCMILGLAVGVSNNNDGSGTAGDSFASIRDPGAGADTGSEAEAPDVADTAETCTPKIAADADCYLPMTMMRIAFENCDALHDDWVGIYNLATVDPDSSNLRDKESMWLWTCNSQVLCNEESTFLDELPFGGGLPAGVYFAALVRRNEDGPFSAYAVSESWTVSENC
jgi:hypothetical protein